MIPEVISALNSHQSGQWDSLIIDRRKPHTLRISRMFGDYRICLHRFESCTELQAFAHPHPWPGAFTILSGSYKLALGRSNNLEDKPKWISNLVMQAWSQYEITDPLVWHKVQPLETTYTIMANGPVWDVQHSETRTTKGKDLKRMTDEAKERHIGYFRSMLLTWQRYP